MDKVLHHSNPNDKSFCINNKRWQFDATIFSTKIVSENKVTEIKPKIEKNILTYNFRNNKKMLVSTVENAEAKWDRPKATRLVAKPTAQVPIRGHYDPSKTIASFIGFGPADDPKFLTLVVLYEPKTSLGF